MAAFFTVVESVVPCLTSDYYFRMEETSRLALDGRKKGEAAAWERGKGKVPIYKPRLFMYNLNGILITMQG